MIGAVLRRNFALRTAWEPERVREALREEAARVEGGWVASDGFCYRRARNPFYPVIDGRVMPAKEGPGTMVWVQLRTSLGAQLVMAWMATATVITCVLFATVWVPRLWPWILGAGVADLGFIVAVVGRMFLHKAREAEQVIRGLVPVMEGVPPPTAGPFR